MRGFTLLLGCTVLATPLVGQGNCSPSPSSREAQVFAHVSVPLAYGNAQAPWIYRPGLVQLSVEGAYLPEASARIRTPAKCRPGAGPEDWNQAQVLPRPRVGFALADGVMLELSWLPPVRIQGVKGGLWGFAFTRVVPMNRKGALFSGRLHATIGSVRAPITCPTTLVQAPGNPCSGGSRSDDKFSPNIYGVELAGTFPMARGRIRPYLGAGYNILHPRFEVSYRDSLDQRNHQKVKVNMSRITAFGGVTLAVTEGILLSGEAYSAPSDLVTGRVRLTVGFGGRRVR
ncbi:MAG: hypothetical protein IPJ57_18850 [Gemmatimonadetes bacterium]|nr:hypothetical protein [Gemmatimonadota bacterium]